MRGRQWYALLDNASIHKTKKVKEFAKREGIPLVYNVKYSPQYNGIEEFWGCIKRCYKAIGTRNLLDGKHRDLFKEAKEAADSVTDEVAIKCARRGMQQISKIDDQDELF